MKKIKVVLKLRVPGGQATPAPPIGPAFGQHGLNTQEFCVKFNEATKDRMGKVVPVEVIVYEDRTYDFKLKTSITSELNLKEKDHD